MKEKELNREERNKTVMETGALVMAEFYADWCPHCQKMMPIVKEFGGVCPGLIHISGLHADEFFPGGFTQMLFQESDKIHELNRRTVTDVIDDGRYSRDIFPH